MGQCHCDELMERSGKAYSRQFVRSQLLANGDLHFHTLSQAFALHHQLGHVESNHIVDLTCQFWIELLTLFVGHNLE
jgi:hypothetical protein